MPPPPLLQATTAAIGSAVGNAIVFPLDLATTRMQHASTSSNAKKVSLIKTLQQIIHRHGYARLYSGLSADTLSTVLSSFLYFLIYASLEKSVHQWRKRRLVQGQGKGSVGTMASPAGIGAAGTTAGESSSTAAATAAAAAASSDILIGTIAGIASKRLALPISAVCIRQQLGDEKPQSIQETLREMRRETGLAGLFHIPLSSALLALLPSLTLYFHETIQRRVPFKPTPTTTFVIAAASNALATIPLYPLILAKSQSLSGHQRDRTFLGPFKRVVEKEGVAGLYKGIEAQLLKGLVQQGVMMVIKQRLEQIVRQRA